MRQKVRKHSKMMRVLKEQRSQFLGTPTGHFWDNLIIKISYNHKNYKIK